jgi:hypothetical protein
MTALQNQLWTYETYSDLAFGFAALSALSALMLYAFPRLRLPDVRLSSPEPVKVLSLAGFVAGLGAFSVFAYVSGTSLTVASSGAAWDFFHSQLHITHDLFGILSVGSLGLSSLSLVVLFSRDGLLRSLRRVALFYTLPAMAVFEIFLSLVDLHEMPLYAAFFLRGSPLAGLLSNWSLLVIASGLSMFGVAPRLSLKTRAARAAPLALILMLALSFVVSMLLISAPSVHAASVYVQQNTNQGTSIGSPYKLTCSLNTQQIMAGDLLVFGSLSIGNGINSVTDGANTWAEQGTGSHQTSGSGTSEIYLDLWTTLATTSPSSLTMTATYGGSVSTAEVECAEFAGIGSSTAVGTTTGGATTGTSSTYATSMTSFTPTSNDLVLFFYSSPTCASSLSWSTAPTGTALTAPTSDTGANANCDGASDKDYMNLYGFYILSASGSATTMPGTMNSGSFATSHTDKYGGVAAYFSISSTVLLHVDIPTPTGATQTTYTVSVNTGQVNGSSTKTGTTGVTHGFTVSPLATVTFTFPTTCAVSPYCTTQTSANYRMVFASISLTATLTACAGGTCTLYNPSDYWEVYNTIGGSDSNTVGPPPWTSGGVTMTIYGTQSGVTGQTICTISETGGGSSTGTCSGWTDYDTGIAPSGATATCANCGSYTRWYCVTTCSIAAGTVESGGNGPTGGWTFTYFEEFIFDNYAYAENNGYQSGPGYGTFDGSMTWAVTGTIGGSANQPICTATEYNNYEGACAGWSDYDTSIYVAASATSPPSNARWESSTGAACSAAFTSDPTSNGVTCHYYKQFPFTLSYTVTYGGSPTAPTLTSTQYGSSYTPTLQLNSPTTYWLDCDTTASTSACPGSTGGTIAWSVTGPAISASGSQRWYTYATVSAHVNTASPTAAGGSFVWTYYDQYSDTLSYSVVDGGSPSAPTAYGTSHTPSYTLTTSATAYWFNATGSISVTTPTSGSYERWSPSPASVSATSQITQVFSMYDQWLNSFSAPSVVPATFNAGFSIPVTGMVLGVGGQTICTITIHSGDYEDVCTGWSDSGSAASVTATYSDGASGQIATSAATTPAITSGNNVYPFEWFLQYQNTLNAVAFSPGTWDTRTVKLYGVQFGIKTAVCTFSVTSASSATQTCSPWLDSGDPLDFEDSNVVNGSIWSSGLTVQTITSGGNTYTSDYTLIQSTTVTVTQTQTSTTGGTGLSSQKIFSIVLLLALIVGFCLVALKVSRH